jgi:hypothetical protein
MERPINLEGTVVNGVVVLDPGGKLPDGTRVEVLVTPREASASHPTAAEAARLRVAWMTAMGFASDEIRQSFDDDPPIDPAKELAELTAAETLKKATPPAAQIHAWATSRNTIAFR